MVAAVFDGGREAKILAPLVPLLYSRDSTWRNSRRAIGSMVEPLRVACRLTSSVVGAVKHTVNMPGEKSLVPGMELISIDRRWDVALATGVSFSVRHGTGRCEMKGVLWDLHIFWFATARANAISGSLFRPYYFSLLPRYSLLFSSCFAHTSVRSSS